MKTITIFALFFIGVARIHGTTLITTVLNSGVEKEVLGIVQTEDRVLFATYAWQKVENNWPAIMPKVLTVEADIPSILIGGEIDYISKEFVVLYANGKQIRNLDYTRNGGWIFSKYLGWCNILSYPYVYSFDDGWKYIGEIVSGNIYRIYSFSRGTWTLLDIYDS